MLAWEALCPPKSTLCLPERSSFDMKGSFRPNTSLCWLKVPCATVREFSFGLRRPLSYNALSVQQMALLSLKGPLAGRKRPFVGLKKALIRPTQKISSQHKDPLGKKRAPLRSKQGHLGPKTGPFRLIRGLPVQHKALSSQRRALLGRKRASVS